MMRFASFRIPFILSAFLLLIFLAFLFAGCAGIPKGVEPVKGFEISRYAGKWYEIARLENSFEKGLDNTMAVYTLRGDGSIDVLNRGFDKKKQTWKQARGRGYFAGDRSVGRLKVSFFRPFYAAYNIIMIDPDNYSYALVCGQNRSYLWILSRTPALEQSVINRLLDYAKAKGFPTESLVFPRHDLPEA